MKSETVEIKIEWFKILLERAKKAEERIKIDEKKSIFHPPQINQLIGFCKSAEFILKK